MPPSCAVLGGFAIGARVALRRNGNITQTRNVSEYLLVLALCLQFIINNYRFKNGTERTFAFSFAAAAEWAGGDGAAVDGGCGLSDVLIFGRRRIASVVNAIMTTTNTISRPSRRD